MGRTRLRPNAQAPDDQQDKESHARLAERHTPLAAPSLARAVVWTEPRVLHRALRLSLCVRLRGASGAVSGPAAAPRKLRNFWNVYAETSRIAARHTSREYCPTSSTMY